jgi:hypothetical protein
VNTCIFTEWSGKPRQDRGALWRHVTDWCVSPDSVMQSGSTLVPVRATTNEDPPKVFNLTSASLVRLVAASW